MSRQLLFIGIAAGLAVAIGIALVFSSITTQSTAQMMGHQGMPGSMDPGMMTTQSTGTPWQWDQRSMFNANGMSAVNNVQITGVSISDSDEVKVSLRYDGMEASPAVTVIAITNPMAMMQSSSGVAGMGIMHDGQNGMMMRPMVGSSWNGAHTLQNNTQWQQWHIQMVQRHGQLNSTQWAQMQGWHNQMMSQGTAVPIWNGTPSGQFAAFQSQTGSTVLDAGWASDAIVTVRLEGTGSVYEGNGIQVMVFPLTG